MAKCRKFIVNFPSTYNLVPTHFSIEIKTVGSNFQFVRRPGRKAVIFLAQTHGATLICTEGRAVFRLEVGIFGKKFNSAAEGRPKFFCTVTIFPNFWRRKMAGRLVAKVTKTSVCCQQLPPTVPSCDNFDR